MGTLHSRKFFSSPFFHFMKGDLSVTVNITQAHIYLFWLSSQGTTMWICHQPEAPFYKHLDPGNSCLWNSCQFYKERFPKAVVIIMMKVILSINRYRKPSMGPHLGTLPCNCFWGRVSVCGSAWSSISNWLIDIFQYDPHIHYSFIKLYFSLNQSGCALSNWWYIHKFDFVVS